MIDLLAARRAGSGSSGGEHARCRVCGSGAVALDEVALDGRLLLGECAHCGHRFTSRPAPGPMRVTRAARARPSRRRVSRAA